MLEYLIERQRQKEEKKERTVLRIDSDRIKPQVSDPLQEPDTRRGICEVDLTVGLETL